MPLNEHNLYEFEGFHINLSERTLWFKDKPIPLAPKLMETLCVLLENQGRLMTKDDLMNEIWGDTFVEERNLTQNIFTLRKIFKEKRKNTKFIETVPRRGYRFVASFVPVETFQEETLSISRTKQMRVSAEGFVSKTELTEAVKEITKNLISDSEIVGNKNDRNGIQGKSFFSLPLSKALLSLIVVSLITIGAAAWFWQSGFGNFRNSASANESLPPLLDYQPLTDSGNAFYPAISPDKQFIAYILNEKSEFSLRLKHITTGSETTVVEPKKYELRSPQFSSDGNYLFYGARDGKMETTIYRVPIFGGNPRQIITNVNQNFSISSDGNWLAYFRYDPKISGNHLLVCRSDGSDERIVSTKKDGNVFRVWGGIPGWSPDGKRLVAVVLNIVPDKNAEIKRPFLIEINIENGEEKILNAPEWYNPMYAVWTSDGNGLIVLAQENPDSLAQLYRLFYPGGEARPVTNDTNNYTEFGFAPGGDFIIATEEKTPYNLQLISVVEPSRIRSLTDSTHIQRGNRGLEWTPDGKYLIYTQMEGLTGGNIWKIDVETLETTQLTFDKGKLNYLPDVSPDGKSFFFASNRTGNFHIWKMNADGTNLKQVTDGIGENVPQISPDGNWLVYATPAMKPDALWKVPISGGEPVKLLEGAGGKSRISPDMTQIIASYYDPDEKVNDPWKYILIPFEKTDNSDYSTHWQKAISVGWKPDGRGLYFVSEGQSHTNIYLTTLPDKTTRPITNFDTQVIINFSVSPDGKTFAVARGKKTSNIIKISGF